MKKKTILNWNELGLITISVFGRNDPFECGAGLAPIGAQDVVARAIQRPVDRSAGRGALGHRTAHRSVHHLRQNVSFVQQGQRKTTLLRRQLVPGNHQPKPIKTTSFQHIIISKFFFLWSVFFVKSFELLFIIQYYWDLLL